MARFVPARLKEAILIRRRKLDELAHKIGITKQAISKYINNKSMPSEDVFSKLIYELNVPQDFLLKEGTPGSKKSSPLFFRTNRSTTKAARDYAQLMSEWSYEILHALRVPATVFPELLPDARDGLTVSQKALRLRETWGIGTGPIENLCNIVESHGFFVFFAEGIGSDTDAYSQVINGIPIIIVERNQRTAVRQRFSIAHELGHLCLHAGISKTEFELHNKRYEAEASAFANEFLMPSVNYKELCTKYELEEFLKIKPQFKISLAAMIYNCQQQDLIKERQAKKLMKEASSRWGRKKEPYDDELENEAPRRVSEMIMSTLNSQEDFKSISRKLRLPLDVVASMSSVPQSFFDQFKLTASTPQIQKQFSLFE